MFLRRISINNAGIALGEYVLLLGIVTGAIAMTSQYYQKAIKNKVAKISDAFLGAPAGAEYKSAFEATGGKQFADQSGLYAITGTTDYYYKNYLHQESQGNSRYLYLEETQDKKAPGNVIGRGDLDPDGEFYIDPIQKYTLRDTQPRKSFAAPHVNTSEGAIETPTSN